MIDIDELKKVKEEFTLDDVKNFLEYLNAEPVVNENKGSIVSKTICHCGERHKLYYYDDSKLFHCYTECNDSFDIFELVKRNKQCSMGEAFQIVLDFFGKTFEEENVSPELSDWSVIRKLQDRNGKKKHFSLSRTLSNYDENIITYLPMPNIQPWKDEGITQEILERNKIRYNPKTQAIVIPFYDDNNNLIGIRERTLIVENEVYGKYRPSVFNNIEYRHPLGITLYNLNNSKKNISLFKTAIVFESEKSCLKYASYFGSDCDISVATCGCSLHEEQVKLLLKYNVQELIVGYDKQFLKVGDKEYKAWVKKLTEIDKKYRKYLKVSFLFDTGDLLGYKDAPIDCGKETFCQLYKERIVL